MARPISELLKNFGKMFEVTKVLINAILDMGGSDDDLLRVLKDKTLARKFAEIVMEGRGIMVADGCELIAVNYGLKLVEAIAEGAFDWKNDDITSKNFKNADHEKGEATLKVKLFHFGRDMSSEDVVKEMDKDSFRPATLRELVAFAAKFPDEQRKYAIVGLGSVMERDGDRDVPCLDLLGHERGLDLSWWGGGWGGYYRFLAVSKS